jgi:NAD(P)-dependent dehydrogenase (short-subunit alcohol dehydrogenase family)
MGAGCGRMKGRRALITGAASGIGRRTAERFLEEGAMVCMTDARADAVDDAASELDGAIAIAADVTDGEALHLAVEAAVAEFGGLDTVVCNAGVGGVGGVAEVSEADWDRQMDVNLKGTYLTAKACWPHLQRNGGSIAATASVAAIWGMQQIAAYAASKAGVVMLVKCMALDGAAAGIRANCVCPGNTDTPILHGYLEQLPDPKAALEATERSHPLGRIGRDLDHADAFVYLSSAEASWVTGAVLTVDGGMTVGSWA